MTVDNFSLLLVGENIHLCLRLHFPHAGEEAWGSEVACFAWLPLLALVLSCCAVLGTSAGELQTLEKAVVVELQTFMYIIRADMNDPIKAIYRWMDG